MNRPSRVRPFIPVLVILLLAVVPGEAQFLQEGGKLVGSDAAGSSWQGSSVSLSADGNTAIVGGSADNAGVGAAWVYTRSGGVWSQQGIKLVGAGAVGSASQGTAVSLSADGNTAIVGGPYDDGGTGAVWVYTRSGGVWSQQGSKLVGTGATVIPYQGYAVALSADGNTAIVGGYYDNGAVGAAWVYTRSGGVWTQQGGKLVGTGSVGPAFQGYSVSLAADGNTAIVGGYYDDGGAGAAWVYTRSGGVWSQQGGKLSGSGATGLARQGVSVSLSADGNTAIVGGYADDGLIGAAWVYTWSGGVWTQQGGKLVGSGVLGGGRQGWAVSLSGDGNTAIVGGIQDNLGSGAAWVYTRSGGVWNQLGSKLVGTGSVGSAFQGYSVSLSEDGNTAMVGGYADNGYLGAAWVYYRSDPPLITAIADIADDQGGQVRLTWTRSPADHPDVLEVSSYGIFRQSSSGYSSTAKILPLQEGMEMDTSLLGYDYVASVPAYQLSSYQTVVPTLEDSSSTGTHYFRFLVVAQSNDLGQYFVSSVDSGYSVDNLSPIPPAGLLATVVAGPQVQLTWNPPSDPDVGRYTVYRSTASGFTPAPGDSIGASHSTSFTDTSPILGVPSYYRIVAVDVHDNASGPSDEAAAAVTVNQQFGVQEKWNIVSVPLQMGDYTKTVLFPTATTPAYAYVDGYFGYVTLENGRAYWLKFSGGETISHLGLVRTQDTVAVSAGWNMVGSLSASIPVTNVGSVPGGLVTSNFFGYDGGYSASPTLEPGRGYWVKVSQAGQLVMTSTSIAPVAERIRIADEGELPPPPPDAPSAEVPEAYALEQNYPNPFNPVTTINYALPVAAHVTLSVYNTLGQEMAALVNEVQEAGYRSVRFDAAGIPSGVYVYRITAGTFSDVKRMLLIK